MDPLPVVTVSLRGGKQNWKTIISSLSCLWYSVFTNRMIKSKHTGPYERIIHSNRVEYSKDVVIYCTTYDVKLPFFMQ